MIKYKFKSFVFISLFLAGLTFSYNLTRAATTTISQTYSIDYDTISAALPQRYTIQTLGNGYTGIINELTVQWTNTSAEPLFSICVATTSTRPSGSCGGASYTRYDPISSSSITGQTKYKYTDISITSDKYLSITIQPIGATDTKIYGNAQNRFINGACYSTSTTNSPYTSDTCDTLNDLYFYISLGYAPITFVVPNPNSETPDFAYWTIAVQNAATTTETRSLIINYATTTTLIETPTTNTLQDIITGYPLNSYSADFVYIMPKTNSIANNATTTWFAQALLYNLNTLIGSSDITTFYIQPSSTGYIGGSIGGDLYPTKITTSTVEYPKQTQRCEFTDILCHISNLWATFYNLMILPIPQARIDLRNAIYQFQSIPPFSYYFTTLGVVRDASNNYNVATTTTLALTIQGLKGENLSLVTINSSTLKTAITVTTSTTIFGTQQACNGACATARINNLYFPLKMITWIGTLITVASILIFI